MNQGSNDLQISSKAGATNRPAKDLITYVTTLSVFTAKGKIAIGVRGRGHFKIRGKSPSFDSNNAKIHGQEVVIEAKWWSTCDRRFKRI